MKILTFKIGIRSILVVEEFNEMYLDGCYSIVVQRTNDKWMSTKKDDMPASARH